MQAQSNQPCVLQQHRLAAQLLNGLLRNLHPSAPQPKTRKPFSRFPHRCQSCWLASSRVGAKIKACGIDGHTLRAHFQATEGDASTEYAGQRWPHLKAVSLILKASICRTSTLRLTLLDP